MSIKGCVEKLVAVGKVTRKAADDALSLYDRMNARYSADAGPASAEAAAALATARALRKSAADKAARIANDVRAFTDAEARVLEHPYGRKAGLMALMTKDMWREGKMVRDLAPDSLVKQGANVDYLHAGIRAKLFNMFGAGMEAYKPGFLSTSAETIRGVRNMVHEIFGAETGDQTAKVAAAGWKKASDTGVDLARGVGKIIDARERYIPQHWTPERVAKFPEQEYVDAYKAEAARGGLKIWDKDFNKPAQTGPREDFVLRRAYNDIKGEGSSAVPFSAELRTFQFEPGAAGADSFLRMQAKFGVGDDVLAMMTGHLDKMAQEVALSRVLGNNPEATFAALLKKVKQEPDLPVGPGAERFNPARLLATPLQTEAMLRNTFKVITGRANVTRSEVMASVVGGARDLIGASSLRNLPISIMPSDTVTTLLASAHLGMDGFKVLGELVDGSTSKEAAAHLQINVHSTVDYINNSVRKYEDEINYSGLARKLTRGVVKATGADWWTTAGRRGAQTSFMNQIAEMGANSFDQLNPKFRRFLDAYGFDAAQWDKIRAVAPIQVGGAKYYLNPENIEPGLYERLLNAVQEQSSYAFHQPDARTRAITTGGTERGTISGEVWRSMMQFKQFAMERMTTHLMRVLIDGPVENRIARGLAFMTLSTAAGAVSLQAAAIVAGKDPLDMSSPKFWTQAFIKGGAGGLYGDLLASGIRGDRSAADVAAEFTGPLPGLAADAVRLAGAPIRAELDDSGRPKKDTLGREMVNLGRRNTPNTWYTKLAIDRLWWDKLQTLADPDYRQSFRRSEQNARKLGQGFWWELGESAPQRPPDLSTIWH